MIAARFRLIAWVAGCAFAALLCYMASQSVAAERTAVSKVDGQIAETQNDIRRLETEIAARSRMGQLERWNQVLALQAARPVQYVANEVQLASLAGAPRQRLDTGVQMASYEKPAAPAVPAPQTATAQAPAPAIQAPMLREATYVQDKPSRLSDEGSAAVTKTSLDKPAPKPAAPKGDVSGPAKLTLASYEPAPRKISHDLDIAPKPAKVAPARPAPVKLAALDVPTHTSARADDDAHAKPRHKAKADDGLLPADLGTLIAAEKKGAHKKAAL